MPEMKISFIFEPSVFQLAMVKRLEEAGLTVPEIMRRAVSKGLKVSFERDKRDD